MKFNDSRGSTTAIAHVDPHYPSFLTGVTAPAFIQSTDSGRLLVSNVTKLSWVSNAFFCFFNPFNLAENSSYDKSAN